MITSLDDLTIAVMMPRFVRLANWAALRTAIQPRDNHPKYYRQHTVADDLLDNDVCGHRLDHEINRVGRHGREQCDSQSEAHTLCHPRLRLRAARIDPHERAGQHQMRDYHLRKMFSCIALRPEQV